MNRPSHQFTMALEQLVISIQAGEPGRLLTDVLVNASQLLAREGVVIAADEQTLSVNGEALPSASADVLRGVLRSNGIQRVCFASSATASELLQFAALLFEQREGATRSFPELWQTRGTWGIRIDPLEPWFSLGDEDGVGDAEIAVADDIPGDLRAAVRSVGLGASWAPETAPGGVLIAAGAEATRVLLESLARAQAPVLRRRYFDAIVGLRIGVPHLMRALFEPTWFVARNAALLLGELAAAEADQALSSLITHADSRVRAAAVTSLGKLDTPLARQTVESAVADPTPRVRAEAWAAMAVRAIEPPWALLADALRAEREDDVLRSILVCLGRYPHPQGAPLLVRLCARKISEGSESALTFDALEILATLRPRAVQPFLRSLMDSTKPLVRARAQMLQQRVLEGGTGQAA